MAHRLLYDPDNDGWERSDFPIVCETCLGPNPYVRMQRIEFGGTCHISGRPYTVFRWRPGNDARYKKTIVCQEVAKAKNVCQVCLLDLDYGLPVQVRDSAMGVEKDDIPQSDVNKEFKLDQLAESGELGAQYTKGQPNDLILKLQRTTPYYKRNMAPICSFFVRGMCNRGAECPYRHELPTTGELAEQNIKDRYYGINDPVARKMLRRAGDMPTLMPPEDQTISTLYVGGLTPEIKEDDLKDKFYAFGELQSIKVIEHRNCAFVTYTTRQAAEKAAEEMANRLIVKGHRCKLMWGRPQQPRPEVADEGPSSHQAARPMMMPPQVQMQMGAAQPFQPYGPNYFNLPPAGTSDHHVYPSMDPSAMGTKMLAPGQPPKRRIDGEPMEDPSGKKPRHDLPPPPGPGGFVPMRPMPPPPGYMMRPPPPGPRPPMGFVPMMPHGAPVRPPPMRPPSNIPAPQPPPPRPPASQPKTDPQQAPQPEQTESMPAS
ncbi:hypothetical protein BSKO_09305 [Bryopsis sp. KO-2023]|nr:hypothetical protein BSKO_09305 [Bryopsis sp. KO-2023]